MEKKYICAREFMDGGYLQELNRQFLHPLGLALEVVIEEDGSARFGDVWDGRDDPEGIIFAEGVLDDEKAIKVANEMDARRDARRNLLGSVIQGPHARLVVG